jgi:hypothetical protein
MAFGVFFTFAFAVGTSTVIAESNEEGCCFSIGYGDLMRPCCLGTVPNVTLSSCSVGSRIGGATGFSSDGCPNTAEEAHQAILEEEQGCCFSIGFGDHMQPCCLVTTPHVGLSSCSVGSRIGGATGFKRGSCPDSAEEAQQAIQPVHEPAILEEEEQGCCFSIGLGDDMQPCCMVTTPHVGLSSCSVGSRIGGATGFKRGSCPDSAEEAQQAIQPVREQESQVPHEHPQGCCFSIGFGDLMRPCCLQTSPDVDSSVCNVGSRPGGATGFRDGSCPLTAEDAHQAIIAGPNSAEEAEHAVQLAEESPFGCCFSIGFGTLMRPCCLQTHPSVQLASCSQTHPSVPSMGGARGFTEGACPTTAEEAHETLQHLSANPTTNLLKGSNRHAETSALPYALVGCVSFAAGSLISVVVMMYRRQNQEDPTEFVPLNA